MTEIKYDEITMRIQNPQIQKKDNTVEYGIICGNELIFFIKVGLKGSIYCLPHFREFGLVPNIVVADMMNIYEFRLKIHFRRLYK